MIRPIAFIGLSILTAAAQAGEDLSARLQGATSLRCTISFNVSTIFKDGKRSTESESRRDSFQYDNINLDKGTARGVFPERAADLTVSWVGSSLYLIERTAWGVVMSAVLPQYAAGTQDFILVESRSFNLHLPLGLGGGQGYGSCAVVE